MYAADSHWWHYHIADITERWEGQCWSQDLSWDKPYEPLPGITQLKLHKIGGLCTTPGEINSGQESSSGFQAINLAYHLGATRVVLLGYDMRHHGKKAHWFGDHPKVAMFSNGPPTRFIKTFNTIQPKQYGLEIVNCTPGSMVTAFPFMSLDAALA